MLMSEGCMNKKGNYLNMIILILGESFTVATMIRYIIAGDWSRWVLAAATIFLIALPKITELLFKKSLNSAIYILCTVYSAGHMVGHVYYLYYLLPWWDDLLHFTAGIIFALLGFEFSRALCRGRSADVSVLLIAIFGFCFSVTISVLWEFGEYAADVLFALDTQSDTIIHEISSFDLNPDPGIRGTVGNIDEVIINGQPLGVGGYLDIGLIDTMSDLLLEALGAFIVSLVLIVRKGRMTAFRKTENAEAKSA